MEKPVNIALIGFMGSGKTTVGNLLAQQLGWAFVDTDALIESRAGRPIPDLFREEGEASFRDREAAVIRDVCEARQQVIATGGGAVLRPENVAALREAAWVVWLTARADVVLNRTGNDAATRPILAQGQGDPLTHILRLLGERGPCYRIAADLIVDTSDRPAAAIADEVLRKWERQQKTETGTESDA
ncbi:MAG: shikimate kinase [Armatimonadaceae bacterium]